MFRGREIKRYYVVLQVKAENAERPWSLKEMLSFPDIVDFEVFESGNLSLDEKGKLGVQLIPVPEPEKS